MEENTSSQEGFCSPIIIKVKNRTRARGDFITRWGRHHRGLVLTQSTRKKLNRRVCTYHVIHHKRGGALFLWHLSNNCLLEERPRIETRKIENDEPAGQLMTNDERNTVTETGFQRRVSKLQRHHSKLDWTVKLDLGGNGLCLFVPYVTSQSMLLNSLCWTHSNFCDKSKPFGGNWQLLRFYRR